MKCSFWDACNIEASRVCLMYSGALPATYASWHPRLAIQFLGDYSMDILL
jgi:hypothetical protein